MQIATRVAPFTVAIWVVKISPCFDMFLPTHLPRIHRNYVLWVKIKVCSPNKLNASRKECTEWLGCWVFGRFLLATFVAEYGPSGNHDVVSLLCVCQPKIWRQFVLCKLAMQDMFRPVQRLQRKSPCFANRKGWITCWRWPGPSWRIQCPNLQTPLWNWTYWTVNSLSMMPE